MQKTPPILYKYKAFSNENQRAIVEQMIKRGQVYFAKPSQLNDPFEATPLVTLDRKESPFKYYMDMAKNRMPHASPARRLQVAAEVQRQSENKRELLENACILSLCEGYDNPLLWAHYADNHRGVAIAYKTDLFLEICRPVNYTMTYPLFTLHSEDYEQQGLNVLFTKAKYWEYEQEWRLAFMEDEANIAVLLESKLTPLPTWDRRLNLGVDFVDAVYVGMNMPEADVQRLRAIIKGTPVKLKFMVADARAYGVKQGSKRRAS